MSFLSSTTTDGSLFNRNFVLLWFGQVISNLGDVIFDTTLVLWIATVIAPRQAWTPLAVSGVLFSVAIPSFLLDQLQVSLRTVGTSVERCCGQTLFARFLLHSCC